MMQKILEAKCDRCGETFNPIDEQDLMHGTDEKGVYCGGFGELQGQYSNLPTFAPPQSPEKTNVVQLSSGNEGGWCGDIKEHNPHDECEGS